MTRIGDSCSSLTTYLYAHKTIEDCTGAEEAGIIYGKSGMGNAISALVDKDFASIISNKSRHYKMAARTVHNKNYMIQERRRH